MQNRGRDPELSENSSPRFDAMKQGTEYKMNTTLVLILMNRSDVPG